MPYALLLCDWTHHKDTLMANPAISSSTFPLSPNLFKRGKNIYIDSSKLLSYNAR